MRSFEKINYELRPSKFAERRMILSGLQEVCRIYGLMDYRYIGFGSPFFTDFKLFHKELHVNSMICIEGEEDVEQRITFNSPYFCIKVMMGNSTEVLPKIGEWETKSIAWLDYDDPISIPMFKDLEILFQRLCEGSIFLMTCNRQLKDAEGNKFESTDQFKKKFGLLVPADTDNKSLLSERSPNLIRKMFLNKINEILTDRNRLVSENEKLEFVQLFFFCYQDGAQMLTFGGYLKKKNSPSIFDHETTTKFGFFENGSNPYTIKPPILTLKEIDLLCSKMPAEDLLELKRTLKFLPERDINRFAKLYKYLPTYLDVRT